MAAADLATWRKQNSDPMTVDMVMTDSTTMRAIVMIPRDKSLKDVFNVDDTFLEVECLENGPVVFQRGALRTVKAAALPKAIQLEKQLAAAEKMHAHLALKITKQADLEAIAAAHDTLKAHYDPARAIAANMPVEVVAFMEAMGRRLDAARFELEAIIQQVQKPAA